MSKQPSSIAEVMIDAFLGVHVLSDGRVLMIDYLIGRTITLMPQAALNLYDVLLLHGKLLEAAKKGET